MNSTSGIIEKLKASGEKKVVIAVTDIDGILRGKLISLQKFLKSVDTNSGFCNVIFGWDSNDAVYDHSEVTGWHTGFPDSPITLDLSTFRKIPWNDQVPFFLGDFSGAEDVGGVCPRSLLKRTQAKCADMGYSAMFANEFEWFNFNETPQSLKDKSHQNPSPLTPGMFGYSILRASQNQEFVHSLFDQLQHFDVPLEGLHTETGDGVYEACIEYTDILEAADRAVLFKSGVKEIASKFEIMASFMAKWNNYLPGSGGHIHQSLWDDNNKTNLFYNDSDEHKMSDLMRHYIAGQLHCLPYILPMYAPTVNSYKRLVKGSWAATTVSWGIENRTTALRVVNHGQESMRLETRIPGADANPYLAMSASLASGLYGIQHKLPLELKPTTGNEYEKTSSKKLPANLKDASETMKNSDIAYELFGETFVNHFIKTREWEWEQYNTAVTNWELKRYFEII